MKTSKIILLSLAALILALTITGMFLLRTGIKDYLKNRKSIVYQSFPVDAFHGIHLNVSGKYQVKIRQGREYKVEVGENNSVQKTGIEIADGKLIFTYKTAGDSMLKEDLYIKITSRTLGAIEANGYGRIDLANFQGDSLQIRLMDSCIFIGLNNHFRYVATETMGYSKIELTDETEM